MSPVAVFDLDGTLVDTAPDLCASLNHCLAAAGMAPLPLERVRPYAGHGSRAMLAKAYEWNSRALDPAALEIEVERFLAHYAENIAAGSRLFPGAAEAMDRLEAAGWRLAVCTNKFERFAVRLLEALGEDRRFAAICGADTFPWRKPDPRHLLGTIERAGGDPRAAVMIGDTSSDIDAAFDADVPSILFDFGYDPDERARSRATLIASSYAIVTPGRLGALLTQARTPLKRAALG